jgi:Bacteriocin-protection, YdeI or OmpD-Associated/Domain of unknown function (DUF1905)
VSPRFRGTLDGAAIEVPSEVLAALGDGDGKRPPVRLVINGVELRTTVAVYGRRSYLGIRREVREAMGIASSDTIEVDLEPDTAERTVEVPEDVRSRLGADPEAQRLFDGLSYTHQKEYVDWVTAAKREETRHKRVEGMADLLRSGRKTP